jgi:tetratricopeptide (TPR) repeat protein
MIASERIVTSAGSSCGAELPTTDGTIALMNLTAQIDGLESDPIHGRSTVEGRVELVDLLILRGLIVGRIADYERAEEIAEQLVCDAPAEPAVFAARARTWAVFHRFADALDDLAVAQRLSFDAQDANRERAAIFQAQGLYDEAIALRQEATERQRNFDSVAALAGIRAERGEIEAARQLYAESLDRYRGVSPFPPALLDFALGHMWMQHGRWDDARTFFLSALSRVPAYAQAQGHLAEVEAELGEIDTAIGRLCPLTISSDDPDYAAQLARILSCARRVDESEHWQELAAARYDVLIAIHPEAFADHAAEFWLGAGADSEKALRLARVNLEVRKTRRAHDLLSKALMASQADQSTERKTDGF